MNYPAIRQSLEQYGRDRNWNMVCDSYMRHMRQHPKYIQWKRVLNTATLRAMSPGDRSVLNAMLGIRMAHAQEAAKPVRIYQGM